jgi:polar amino acid transport system substrate-binding protein
MPTPRIGFRNAGRTAAVTTLALALATALAACGGESKAADTGSVTTNGTTQVKVAAFTGAPYTETTIAVPTQADIRATLPKKILDSGQLVIGEGALPAGFPPLAFIGNDQKTLTGSEPDLGRLVAAVFGLKPVIANATWDNLFVGIDSGRNDLGVSNITDTEQRKLKYDFASYRQDNLAFEVKKESAWNFDGTGANLAGQIVAVGSGTNQEKILLEWKNKLQKTGKPSRSSTSRIRTASTWPWPRARSPRTSGPTRRSSTTSPRIRAAPARPAAPVPSPGPAPPCRA